METGRRLERSPERGLGRGRSIAVRCAPRVFTPQRPLLCEERLLDGDNVDTDVAALVAAADRHEQALVVLGEDFGRHGEAPLEEAQHRRLETVELLDRQAADAGVVRVRVQLVVEVLGCEDECRHEEPVAVHEVEADGGLVLLEAVEVDEGDDEGRRRAVGVLDEAADVELEVEGLLEGGVEHLELVCDAGAADAAHGARLVRVAQVLEVARDHCDEHVLCAGGGRGRRGRRVWGGCEGAGDG